MIAMVTLLLDIYIILTQCLANNIFQLVVNVNIVDKN